MRIRSPLPYAPFLAALLPTLAIAHGGASLDAARFGSFEDWMIWPLALALLWYFAGYLRLKRHLSADAPRRADAVRFAAAWLVLAATIATPLHEAGEHSFAAHMLEHELLMLVAAPMFVLSRPIGVALWALPSRLRVSAGRMGRRMRGLWQLLTMTLVATAIQAAALWLWHVPSLFELALERPLWHVAQHASFLLSAVLFWWAILRGHERRRRFGVGIGALFFTATVSGALGALMAFSASPWYAGYAASGGHALGLTPAEDQQLAGLLMWIPGGLVHAGAALVLIAKRLSPSKSEQAHAVP